MPLIAMTREMGSLGKDVAAAVAERLGKPVVHHEIIDHLADKMRLRKSHVIRFLDGKANLWKRLTTDKTSMSIYTADETMALAESRGIGVIRGWGSDHLLRSVGHVICVHVCAPRELRTERMMKRLNSDDRAMIDNEIDLSEEAHAAITRRHFGINWREPEHYDLVLNTERVSIEECVNEVMSLVKDPRFQETDASCRMLANLALEHHVRAALRADPATRQMKITVAAADGVVTLAGTLEPGLEEVDAFRVVAAVPHVKSVNGRLKPQTPSRVKLGI
jgi:cytidylate kinase